VEIKHAKFKHIYGAIITYTDVDYTIRHCTFVDGLVGLRTYGGSSVSLENVLFDGIQANAIVVEGSQLTDVDGSHLTVHDCGTLSNHTASSTTFDVTLKNSLIVDVDTINTYVNQGQSHNKELSQYADAFQTVGAGEFYLKDGSTYRDFSGAATIDATLHEALKLSTTYPPGTVYPYGHQISSSEAWYPIVERDTNTLDLGYHYPPIDYVVDHCVVTGTGTTIDIHPGTVVVTSGIVGLQPDPGASINAVGNVFRPVIFNHYRALQEQTTTWNYHSGCLSVYIRPNYQTVGSASQTSINIEHCDIYSLHASPPFSGGLIGTSLNYYLKEGVFKNNRFFNSDVGIIGTSGSYEFFNNVFEDATVTFGTAGPVDVDMRYNNFIDSELKLNIVYGDRYYIDNAFDNSPVTETTSVASTHHHNGYINSSSTFLPLGTNDVVISGTYTWESGPLGDYYHPSNSALINAGSQLASHSGFYHYTTQTNQVAEASSIVDIGKHYLRLNSSGYFFDEDGDNIADIFEDLDGDGVQDAGETDWQNSENGTTGVSGLTVYFPH